ncbi:hypothetical protein DTO166G4_1329 [Paecilomyces variotii]|nr:hypothetical protein DTO164E3_9232 [Paecilomyces variotii]KAJ9190837.1 hypothetical protein DTO032I3_9126 [Paecilomyces variotii]KAJ9216869.1 hypothetical protein DTO166G4_1329 [Paecilomyces variotii]KAJ9218764.1 hypothetical protein DTO169C6_8912 [Paecilomyces variotii]KAJ9230993.1 hypothetical protein DTO169E5_8161 [Paecilomyces variotii]
MQSQKGDSSQAITVPRPGHDSIPPYTDFSEKALSKDDPANDEQVNTDPEQAQQSVGTEVEPPPDGGYGWVCVSYGIFLAHYLTTNTYPGATDLDFAFVRGLSLSMAQFIAPAATIITREWGTRTTLGIGILLQSGALFGASWSTQVWQLFLSQALCFGFGMGMQLSATVGIIPQWFSRRRSLANGIGTAGSGIGGLVYSLATGALIQQWGTGWSFRILAIVSAAACGFSAILIRDRNKVIGAVQIAFHASLLKRLEFLLTLTWGCFSVLGYVALLFSVPSYASSVGLTTSQGSILGAMFNLGGGLGRPVIGYVSDNFGRINTALFCTFLAGLFSLVIWIFTKSFGTLIFYALIGGAVASTFTTTVAPVGTEVVGLQLLPSALSIFWLLVVIPSTFAEPITLWLRTDNGANFPPAHVFTGFMFIAATISLWLVRAWKISELQKTGTDSDPVNRGADIRDNDAVISKVPSKTRAAKGLLTMVNV